MRTDLRGNPRFTQLLNRVKNVALGAYLHREQPWEKLIEEMHARRESGQKPLFNVVFGVRQAPEEEAPPGGYEIGPLARGQEPARVDLSLWITRGAEEIRAGWGYNADLFEEEKIIRMHSHFATLLSGIVARPNDRLDELEMLTEAERAQQAITRAIREERNYSRFKSVNPRAVVRSED
jgi:non-ribosomal peptide synthetase component F